MEFWKKVKGYEGYYVSNTGNVKSTKYTKERVLKTQITNSGYITVILFDGQKNKKYHYIHRLVAESFIPKEVGLPLVNHLNGKKTDNRLDNIQWSNKKLNALHARDMGLLNPVKGEEHVRAEITENKVREIKKYLSQGIKHVDIAKQLGVSRTKVKDISAGRSWKHIK